MSEQYYPCVNRGGLTTKQYRILLVICDGNGKNDDGEFVPVDMDELLERLSYRTTKQSMQFSIKYLSRRGLIAKGYEQRRGAKRVTFSPTKLARQIMGYHDPHYIESSDLSYLDI